MAIKSGKIDFSQFKPQTVDVPSSESLVRAEPLIPDGVPGTPLLLQPAGKDIDLVEWAGHHRRLLDGWLNRHGALLFRGFEGAAEGSYEAFFETFSQAICDELFGENAEHVPVSGRVQTPVFYPSDQKLLWHNENSFNLSWPTRIIFACDEPPERGGETPIVDSRELFRRLDPGLRQRFQDKQVMYQRTYGDHLGLAWQEVFRTEDKAEVEAACARTRTRFEWKSGDRLTTFMVRPAVVRHPETGELTWFNQAQHWHTSCLDAETRRSMLSLYEDEDLPRQCRYGDGSPIADEDMDAILDLYEELEVSFPWRQGDILVVDNLLMAHARNPYVGPRRILVTMGDMLSYDEV